MIRTRILAGAAAWLALGATAAQATQKQSCVPAPEASAIMLEVTPSLLATLGEKCALLPAGSFVRTGLSPMIERYRTAADAANWRLAFEGFKRIAGTSDLPGDPELLRPLLGSVMSQELVGDFKASDCGAVDDLLRSLEPLPPANTAAMFVAILRLSDAGKSGGKGLDFAICPADGQ